MDTLSQEQQYTKQNPFFASIKSRETITHPNSQKKTFHYVLDLKDSNIKYSVGDSVGIYPQYSHELVNKTLFTSRSEAKTRVSLKNMTEGIHFETFLSCKGDIAKVTQKLFREMLSRLPDAAKKQSLLPLLEDEQREHLKNYLESYEVWDFLSLFPEVSLSPQELVDCLNPLLPRFYSISSSQKVVGNEVHLTIASVDYESNGHYRRGVCTHFLNELCVLNQPSVPIFVQPSHGFGLPSDHHTPLIMIGPGTGVAPFRAFMQERVYHGSQAKHWLFFGERNRATDFYYEYEWTDLIQKGHLELDLAFSRDQNHKVYVQHRMLEKGQQLYQWLKEGAYLYVCGDAKRMAKDVEATLLLIIQEEGGKSVVESREFIKALRQQKKYLRDVY